MHASLDTLTGMKGIILAGGSGTRLHPMTGVLSKQILPVYDKPMIYYPLTTLMLAGLQEILLISTPRDLPAFRALLGTGEAWGLRLSYQEQPSPDGLAQALILAEEFLAGDAACLILGDNIFYGHGLPEVLQKGTALQRGALIFGYSVSDPQRYGVVEFSADGRAIGIEEKPARPKSSYAVPGIYFYDARAPALARALRPSPRGELEITDLNLSYLREGSLRVELMGRGMAWLDTGTPDSLLEAASFIAVLEKRQGLKVGCPEEIAFRRGFIGRAQVQAAVDARPHSDYAKYLQRMLNENY
jgi:glucose-1-phosphate thymidylyltransferase